MKHRIYVCAECGVPWEEDVGFCKTCGNWFTRYDDNCDLDGVLFVNANIMELVDREDEVSEVMVYLE